MVTATDLSAKQDLDELVNGLSRFSYELFSEVFAGAPTSNLVLSPSSVADVLAMAYLGAAGATKAQLAAVLHLSESDESAAAAFQLLTSVNATAGSQLRFGNRVWLDHSLELSEGYRQQAQSVFRQSAGSVDFANDCGAAIRQINAWADDQTEGAVKEVANDRSLGSETRVALANAVSFAAAWLEPFEVRLTAYEPFHLADGSTVPVATMHVDELFATTAAEDFIAVRLPFRKNKDPDDSFGWLAPGLTQQPYRMVMEIIVPRLRSTSMQQALALVLAGSLESLTWKFRKCNLALPKFCLRSSHSLNHTLQSLGLCDVFSPGCADLTPMSAGLAGHAIGTVAQQAMIEVDERGARATAASGTMVTMCRSIELTVDRPFLFTIRDRLTNTVHFIGCVQDPRKS